MDRDQLESAAANYPYLQGLWAIPMGLSIPLAGVSNLQQAPSGPWLVAIFGGILLLSGAGSLVIARYYRDHYGRVTPTRRRQVRHGAAVVAWIVVLFVGANRYLLYSSGGPLCVFASAFALATLAYYAILVGVRTHHLVIWGAVFVAGLLPIWGGLGGDRDALAMIPLGVALIASGLLDHRLLARSLATAAQPDGEVGHAGR